MDKELDYVVEVAMSPEYNLWQYYNEMAKLYVLFINSATREMKKEHIAQIREMALTMNAKIKVLLNNAILPARVIRNVNNKVRDTFNSYFLNLTQLFQGFVHAATPQVKTHYLTALYFLLLDLSELCTITDTEPERLLDLLGE